MDKRFLESLQKSLAKMRANLGKMHKNIQDNAKKMRKNLQARLSKMRKNLERNQTYSGNDTSGFIGGGSVIISNGVVHFGNGNGPTKVPNRVDDPIFVYQYRSRVTSSIQLAKR